MGFKVENISIVNKETGKRLVGLLDSFDGAAPAVHQPCTIVLVHAQLCHKNFGFFPALSHKIVFAMPGVSVFRFDLSTSGVGESEGEFSFADYARDVSDIRAVVEHFDSSSSAKYGPVVGLVGMSKGGNDVWLYQAKYGDVPMIVNVASLYNLQNDFLTRAFTEQNRADLEKGGKFVWSKPYGSVATPDMIVTRESIEDRMNTVMDEHVRRIKNAFKALIVIGSNDEMIPMADAKKYHEVLGSLTDEKGQKLVQPCELRTIWGADHYFNRPEHKQQIVDVIFNWFKRHLSA